jgi:uncharacterized protein involved in outer membrane biogenesis
LLALLGLASLCVIWLFTTNLGVFKPQIEQLVSERIGRDFSINGELNIHLGRSLDVSAENIVLENADWAGEPAMVSVGRLSVRVDLWSIYAGPIVVELIDIDDMALNLVNSETDEKNWEFELAGGTDQPEVQEEPLGLWLQTLEIDAVRIVYEDAHRPEPVDIHILSLRQQRRDDDMLETSVDATVNERAIEFRGTWGTWTSLLAGSNVEFDANGQLDTISVQAKGLIDDLRKPNRPVIDFNIAGPNIEDISAMLGLGEVGEGDVELSGSLSSEDDGPMRLRILGNLGQTRIDVTGSSLAIDNFDEVGIVATASGPSLGRVLSYAGIDQVGDAPFEVELNLQRTGTIVSIDDARATFGESVLEANANIPKFPALDDATVGIELTGPRIERLRHLLDIPGAATGPFSVRLDVKADELGEPALRATVQTNLGKLVVDGLIGDPPDYIGSTTNFEFDAPSLSQLGRVAGVESLPNQPITARGSVTLQDSQLQLNKPLHIRTEGVALAITGSVQLAPRLSGTAVQIEVNGVDIRDALHRFGIDGGIPPLPFDVSGTVQLDKDGIELPGISAKVGSSAIRLQGQVSFAKGLSGTRVRISGNGPSMEELFSGLDEVDVVPGPFDTEATIRLGNAEIEVKNFKLERERGKVALDAKIGWPLATNRLKLQLDASGPDIRSLFTELGGFEPEVAPFRIRINAERDGNEWSFQPIQASLRDANMEARGQLMLAPQSVSGNLKIEANAPNLASLGRYLGRPPRQLPVHLSATLSGEGDRVVIDDLSAGLGESDISGQIVYRFTAIPELELGLQSASIRVLPIFEAKTNEPDESPPPADGRVIPAVEIPFDSLRKLNATFSIEIGELQRDNFRAENVQFRGNLRDGTLSVDTLKLDTRDGNFQTSGRLVAQKTGGHARLKLTADDIPLTNSPNHPVRANINLDILASGSTLREFAANSNGFFVLQAGDGEFKNNAMLDAFTGGFAQELLSTINPFAEKADTTKVDCAVVTVNIVDGVVQGKPAAFAQTGTMRVILADAVLDLNTEEIKIAFETHPRKGVSLPSVGEVLNPYIGVFGTFSKPVIRIDQETAFIAGGAAVATAGVSILAKGLWDRIRHSGDACERAATYAEQVLQTHSNQGDP